MGSFPGESRLEPKNEVFAGMTNKRETRARSIDSLLRRSGVIGFELHAMAIASISTLAPRGSAATPTVARAGKGAVKNLA